MTPVLIELTAPDFPEVHIHTQVTFSPIISEGAYINIGYHAEQDDFDIDKTLTPIGKAVYQQVETVAGVGSMMVGHYGFTFRMGKAFNHGKMLMEVLDILQKEFGDNLDISVKSEREAPVEEIGPYAGEEHLPQLRELTAKF